MLSGRIIRGLAGVYNVSTARGVYSCQARGLFRKEKVTPLVGDNALISVVDEGKKEGYLQEILPRKNCLVRPRAANVDLAVIVFAAARPDINWEILDTFLIFTEKEAVESVIVINKIDYGDNKGIGHIFEAYGKAGYQVFGVSALENRGFEPLRKAMDNKTSIMAGPSGVGKTSIINRLCPHMELKTGDISKKIGRGKHTTRHAELMEMGNNTFIVDSPGFTSLTLNNLPKEEIQLYYREFAAFRHNCYYGDCLHTAEHDCAVKEQVGKSIDPGRYERYLSFLRK